MRRLPAALALTLAAAALTAHASNKPSVESASEAPAWIFGARDATVPGDLGGTDSLVLLDEWVIAPLAEGGVRREHRTIERVLRTEGMAPAGRFVFGYNTGDKVEAARAWNLLSDGTMKRPDPHDDVVDLPYTSGASTVDDARIHAVTIPGVIVGSVVATESIVVDWLDRGAFTADFGSVDGPTGACRITLKLPTGWTSSDVAKRADEFTRTATADGLTWSASHLSTPAHEEWTGPDADRRPQVTVGWRSPDGKRGYADWAAVAAWYRDLANPVLAEAGEAATVSAKLKPADPTKLVDALRDAFAFASRDVRYVAIELGIGGYKPQAPEFTCSRRFGDCKAKSFLMRSIVEPWGAQAFPVLVRTRDAGELIREVPSPGQFNHCIVAVKLPDGAAPDAWNVLDLPEIGRIAILDPTTESLGPWQLRPDDQGTTALLVLPDSGRLIDLPVQPPSAGVESFRIEAPLDESGTVGHGTIVMRSHGTSAGEVRGWLSMMNDDQARQMATGLLQAWVPGARLVDRKVDGTDSLDGDVTQTITFEGGRIAQRAGDLLVVEPAIDAFPFPSARLPPPPRVSPLRLGLPEERRVELVVTAPAGWRVESLPKPAKHESKDLSLDCAWEPREGGYATTCTGRLLSREIAPADYDAFRKSARAASSAESEGVVLVKATESAATPPAP